MPSQPLPAFPVSFAGCAGVVHAGTRSLGVVLCRPWGFEDLCTRKAWRELAETLAAAGLTSLAFDYPGTGDALGDAASAVPLEGWVASVAAAADELRRNWGVERIALLGQGLGASLAYLAAPRIAGTDALVLMAPVLRGRAYLREIGAWEQMIAGSMGYAESPAPGTVRIAGFELSAALAAELQGLDLAREPLPRVEAALLVNRPVGSGALEARLREGGAKVSAVAYRGYDELVSNPISAVTPAATFAEVAAWLAARPSRAAAPVRPQPPTALEGPHFRETGLRFGPDATLAGVLCEPLGRERSGTALILNTGSDHHIGWARSGVAQARALAAAGIATLRFDSAGIGDSPPYPHTPAQVIYSDAQIPDAVAALDVLEARGLGPAILVGRCSGAYLALTAALADERVTGLVLVNIRRFVWNPEDTIEEALRDIPRRLDEYGSRMVSAETWRRLLRREVNIRSAAVNIAGQLVARFAPRLARGRSWSALHREAHRRFALLRERDLPVSLIYGEGDLALDEYAAFLDGGAGLGRYPNMTATVITDADHNFTTRTAQANLVAAVCAAVRPAEAQAPARSRRLQRA